jgi:hypothetical protein
MGIRDKIRRLERETGSDMTRAVCLECGAEKRVRDGILFDLTALQWEMRQNQTDELLADRPQDIRWVWEHPHGGLSLVDKHTREPIFGHKWASAARMKLEAREDGS